MFCLLLLQLDPNFNIQALKALITPKVVDAAIAEVKNEMAARQEGATSKEATLMAATGGTSSAASANVEVVGASEGEEAN